MQVGCINKKAVFKGLPPQPEAPVMRLESRIYDSPLPQSHLNLLKVLISWNAQEYLGSPLILTPQPARIMAGRKPISSLKVVFMLASFRERGAREGKIEHIYKFGYPVLSI